MKKITKRKFDAYCYSRRPMALVTAEEMSWFEAFDRKILATIIRDVEDGDYGFVILGRDARCIFRCLEVSSEFYLTVEEAENVLEQHMAKYENDGKETYPQGDEVEAANEILIPCVGEEKLHPYFQILISEPRLEAARNIIREIVYSYVDVDGNYIREFQTGGFDSRLWELYLYVYLHNAGFEIIRDIAAPDYHVSFYGEECFIEAVTVNPSKDSERPMPEPPKTPKDIALLKLDYLPIKFGSSLYSKLQKKYWEKKHVKGKPFILAIHDYHMLGSMVWSRTALCDYLYGVRVGYEQDKNGKKVPHMEKIEYHSWQGKFIPSNFFAQPNAENISAILFSNAATITKFNRMGKLAGLGSKDVKLIRHGFLFNPDPNSFEPIPFTVDTDAPEYEESWSDSLVMYHNPNAKYPVDPDWFWDISHIFYDSERETFFGHIQPYDVLSSITFTITATGKEVIDEGEHR